MTVARLVDDNLGRLTRAERRVAELLLTQPQLVAFSTVAQLATAAETSGASVVRFAGKLGFDGFAALQARVQEDLTDRLRPAVARIREPSPTEPIEQVLATELTNLHATLEGIDRDSFDRAVDRIMSTRGRVLVLAGDCLQGVADILTDELYALRPGVESLAGNVLRIGRVLADLSDQDTTIAMDVRRYDRWVLAGAQQARRHRCTLICWSDSPLSPLAELADYAFTVQAVGVGPFDSQVATLALAKAFVAAAARRLAPDAAPRLDAIEDNWQALRGHDDRYQERRR